MPVVAVDVAPIRAEPGDDAEQVTQALRGEPVTVEQRRGGWARVRTAYEYPGWIRADVLADAEPGSWLDVTSSSAVEAARAFLGTPYEWGGMSERGIDCSGLVHMAYRRTGRLVPRDAHEQEDAGEHVEEPRPGDLVTYGDAARADHTAFWLGGGRILHATNREGVHAVVEEDEPESLRSRRRRFVRL
jgi:gamma-D-glutamyl-L-lysine dipeptidyl-peptidase